MYLCENTTSTRFDIKAFTTFGSLNVFLFVGLFLMYMTALTGNLIIALLICKVPQLHTPMYFFLCNLSFAEIMYVSNIFPNTLSIILTGDKTMSFPGCITQLYFYVFSGDSEVFLLTCMSYDRYVAVCTPLYYSLIMRRQVCIAMVGCCLVFGTLNSLMFTLLTSTLSFCYSHEVDHFFCEIRALMVTSSSDTTSREIVLFFEDFFVVSLSFLLIFVSYGKIISTVLKIRFLKGRLRTFSSCSSHLSTVILFYGPVIFLYIKPQSENSKDRDKLLSLLYMGVVPALNPFVYTLRNKEVTGAISKVLRVRSERCWGSCRCTS